MTTGSISTITPRLSKLILLLSSDQSGEVVNAAGAIGRALDGAGLTWHDLAAALTASPASPSTSRKAAAADSRDDATALSMVRAMLGRDLPTKRRRFLSDLLTSHQRWGRFTQKQRDAIARSWQWTREEEAT